MLLAYDITLPAGGSSGSLTSAEVKYPPGIVRRGIVIVPDGCAGPVGLDLPDPPHELVLEGWNEDDTYEHTLLVYLVIEPLPPPAAISFEDLIRAQVAANAGVAL